MPIQFRTHSDSSGHTVHMALIDSSGRRISGCVDVHKDLYNYGQGRPAPASLNWSACGSVGTEHAKEFMDMMEEAIKIAKEMDEGTFVKPVVTDPMALRL